MQTYPINLELTGKQVLVVGGGRVAVRKIKRLASVKAEIKLVSPELSKTAAEWVDSSRVTYFEREFKAEDITEQWLIIAATDDQAVNRRIEKLAQSNNKLVNVVDSKELSNFTLPAVVKQGDLLLTVATGGNLPALSRVICRRLEEQFGPGFASFLQVMKAGSRIKLSLKKKGAAFFADWRI